jgi:energy-coupling factor transporter transmembrane protein EcfT
MGNIIATAVILLTLTSKVPALQAAFEAWLGLIQRIIIIPFMLWLFLFALRFHKAKG